MKKIKISKRQLAALKHCIDKRWKVYVKVGYTADVPSCRLCVITNRCCNCIISLKVSTTKCHNTPFIEWRIAKTCSKLEKKCAKKELKFLEDLYKEGLTGYIIPIISK